MGPCPTGRPTAILWGDSFANQYLEPISSAALGNEIHGLIATQSGCRAFVDGEAARPEPQRIDPAAERLQAERTAVVRAGRDAAAASEALTALGSAAGGTENLLPRIRACVEADVTLGEIADALRTAWGEFRP